MSGPGTELAKIFHSFWVRALPHCPCRLLADLMDEWGCDAIDEPLNGLDVEFCRAWIAEHKPPDDAANTLTEWLCRRTTDIGRLRREVILDSLGEEAERRRLPYHRGVASMLLRAALRRARKAESCVVDLKASR